MKTCISTYLHRLTLIAALLIVLWPLQSCEDDFPSNKYEIGDGESLVTGEITFQPLKSSLNGDARGENGNLISSVNNLNVVIYKVGGEDGGATFFKKHYLTGTQLGTPQTNTSVPDDYKDYQGNVATKAEEQTKKYKFELPEALPFGKYYIYAVANMNRELTSAETATPDALQSIVVSWQSDVSLNGQMFGYFNPGSEKSDGTGNLGNSGPNEEGVYAAPAIIVNQAQTHVHAWMRRLASKLTICFDGSKLSESVFVYIHKATIKQIPKQCILGKVSAVGGKEAKDTLNYIDGQTIYYNAKGQAVNTDPAPAEANFRQWLEIAKGTPIQGARDSIGGKLVYHPENALSLFFYENMQGDFSKSADKDKYDKRQNEAQTGTNIISPSQPDYKDNVPCGTYIEVEGFYVNRRPESQSSGKIIYRFMLGQDITYNYDVMRNQHYKLDMCFKGLANQVDWHITYQEETPGNYPPDLLYVPYRYNTRTELPIRLTGNPTRVWIQMVENNWAPYDSTSTTSVPSATVGSGNTAFKWASDVYESSQYYYGLHGPTEFKQVTGDQGKLQVNGNAIPIYTRDAVSTATGIAQSEIPAEVLNNAVYSNNRKATPLWAGFLALQAPSGITDMDKMPVGIFNTSGTDFYSKKESVNNNQKYFMGLGGGETGTSGNTNPQHIRVLDNIAPGTHGNGLNAYRVSDEITVNGQLSRTIYLPLFTRPKAIIYISGFGGNNPYEYYPRKAVLRITAEYKLTDGTKKIVSKEMTVVQERRIVNPKAVWRKAANSGEFTVTLSQLKDPTVTDFQKIYSYGEWEAKVVQGNANFEIKGNSKGGTRDPIEFTINFKNKLTQGTTACGMAEVTYHGGTCSHRIFLRQGYDAPIQIVNDGAKWSSYCLYRFTEANGSKGELTSTPTAVSSFFRRLAGTDYDFRKAIRADNNIEYGPLVSVYDKQLQLTDGTSSTWQQVPGKAWGTSINGIKDNDDRTTYTWPNFHVDSKNRDYRLPTYDDFNKMLSVCDFGYGVLYADATATALTQVEAYGQNNYDSSNTGHGMRGVMVYNKANANQVFFPVGAFGVGRRTLQNLSGLPTLKGYLRYGALRDVLSVANGAHNAYRPVCYNLPASPGAMYWIQTPTSGGYIGWDMNYFDMSFNGQDYGATNQTDQLGNSIDYGSDALLIKPVLAE